MIKEAGLLKAASEDPEVKKALIMLSKLAEDGEKPTEFNESNPAADNNKEEVVENGEAPIGEKQPVKEAVPVGPIAAPIPQAPAGDPATDGARAAQAFMQPAFDAASSGDEAAQKTVALAAGEVARGVAEASSKGAGGQVPVVPEETVVQPQVSPEESVADKIVAQPQVAPTTPDAAQTPGSSQYPNGMNGQYKQSSDQTVSMGTVIKLIKMAKLNII